MIVWIQIQWLSFWKSKEDLQKCQYQLYCSFYVKCTFVWDFLYILWGWRAVRVSNVITVFTWPGNWQPWAELYIMDTTLRAIPLPSPLRKKMENTQEISPNIKHMYSESVPVDFGCRIQSISNWSNSSLYQYSEVTLKNSVKIIILQEIR